MTSKEFALLIEQKVKDKSITHMDAVIEYCDEKKLETDQINHLINRSLKEKIRLNAEAINMLPKSSALPIQKGYIMTGAKIGIAIMVALWIVGVVSD